MFGLRTRAVGTFAVAALITGALASAALGRPIEHIKQFHHEGTAVVEDFCGIEGLDVRIDFVADGSLLAKTKRGGDLAYFLEHVSETGVHTSLANGKSVTQVSRGINQDMLVTDNGDGTLTILAKSVGVDVLYDSDGNVLARNSGQTRVEFLIDHAGTPSDPSDDEFLEFLGVVKGSTGRNDDFCAAIEAELT